MMKKGLFVMLFAFVLNVFAQDGKTSLENIICAEKMSASQIMNFKSNPNTLNYDITYHKLEFTVDPAILHIAGKVSTSYTALVNLDTVYFDLSGAMLVSDVLLNGDSLLFFQNNDELGILLATTQLAGTSATVQIVYEGVPIGSGLGSFIKDVHAGVPILWTLSEPFGARDWWPCKQDLNDKADSIDVYITAPSQYSSVANGIEPEPPVVSGANKTTHFKHKYPIPAYLIAIAVTNYAVHNQTGGTAPNQYPIINYLYPETFNSNLLKLNQTPLILDLYDSLVTPYPYASEKYGHAQFGWGGGMEHTTVSFMVNFNRGLIAHEMAHQWFGDNITCGTWKDIWLNEGFATYFASLVIENFDGESAFISDKLDMINYITSQPAGAVYLTDQEAKSVSRIFDGRLSYYKGAMVLNMLRLKLGDADFFQGLKNYLNDTSLNFGYAVTADFQSHMELVYGNSLSEFFNDWVYEEGYPSYSINVFPDGTGAAQVVINQTQSHASVSFFEMPVPMRFSGAGGVFFDTIFDNTVNGESFYVQLPFAITNVVFDPKRDIISAGSTTTLGIETSSLVHGISVYPNPASSIIDLRIPASLGFVKASVFNNLGQQMGAFSEETISLANMAAGVYVIQIETENGIFYEKIIKE